MWRFRVSWKRQGVWSAPGRERSGAKRRKAEGSAALVEEPGNERWLGKRRECFGRPDACAQRKAGRRTCEGEQRAGARHGAVGVGEREVQRLCAWEDGGGDPSVSRRCAIGGG